MLHSIGLSLRLVFLHHQIRSFVRSLFRLINRADPQRNRHLLPTANNTDYKKANLESTYNADFPPPYPYEMKTVAHSDYADQVEKRIFF